MSVLRSLQQTFSHQWGQGASFRERSGMAELCENTDTRKPHSEWSGFITRVWEAGGFSSRYTHGRCLEGYRGIAVHMLGTSARHRGPELPSCPAAAQHCGSCRRSRRRCGGIRNSRAVLQGSRLCSRRCRSPAWHRQLCSSSGGTLGFAWTEALARLVVLPFPPQELPMAISVTPTSDGPGGTAQTASPSRGLQGPLQAPVSPSTVPQATGPQREGSVPDSASRSLPGGRGCTPHAARSCSAGEEEAALGRPLRSRLPPSLGGPLPPASRWPAAGPICSRGRLLLPGTAALDGSGAEAPEAALCQGAPDWLTGVRNGYLLRVRASDWPRGTCNASSEDAGVRVPARCRGAAAAPPGMAARSRRWPQHPPASGALGPAGQHQQRSQRKICRLFVPLQLAAIATALLMSQS